MQKICSDDVDIVVVNVVVDNDADDVTMMFFRCVSTFTFDCMRLAPIRWCTMVSIFLRPMNSRQV